MVQAPTKLHGDIAPVPADFAPLSPIGCTMLTSHRCPSPVPRTAAQTNPVRFDSYRLELRFNHYPCPAARAIAFMAAPKSASIRSWKFASDGRGNRGVGPYQPASR